MTQPASGSGTPAAPPVQTQTVFIIDTFEPGRTIRIIFLTPDQAAQLPIVPADALQIAIAPPEYD